MSFIINPGTEPVAEATIGNAEENLLQLIKDSGQNGIIYKRIPKNDRDGRFSFVLRSNEHDFTIDVDMPGCDLEKVRASKLFYSPRLYVDGSSWLWDFALTFIDFNRI